MGANTPLVYPHLGSLITDRRVQAGLNRTGLAARTGVSAMAISYIERGQQDPSPELLAALMGTLSISRDEVSERADPVALLSTLWNAHLGARLRDCRTARGWSIPQAAHRMELNESTVRRTESGLTRPRSRFLAVMLRGYGLDPVVLLPEGTWPQEVAPANEFAGRLAEAQRRSGRSARRLAGDLGVAQSTFAVWMAGRGFPNGTWAPAVRALLGVSEQEFEQLRPARKPATVTLPARLSERPELAQILVSARVRAQLSVAEVTVKADLHSRGVYCSWERGTGVPGTERVLIAVADAVGADRVQVARAWLKQRPKTTAVGALIRLHRTAAGLSPVEFADLIGRHRNPVSNWETGKYRPQRRLLPVIAATLNQPVDDLRQAYAVDLPQRQPRPPRPLAAMIRDGRARRGLSLRQFGEMVGVSGNTIRSWQTGLCRPREQHHPAIAAVLQVPTTTVAAAA